VTDGQKGDIRGQAVTLELSKRKNPRGKTPGKYLGRYKKKRSEYARVTQEQEI
jgi:hypothetical protein